MQKLTSPDQLNGPAVLVEFSAEWCQPCKQLEPILNRLDTQLPQVAFYKADVDEHSDLAARFGVRSVPTVFLLKDGEVADQFTGTKHESVIMHMLADAFSLLKTA